MADDTPLAIQACYHIMRRYRNDADFAYYMIGTESLKLVHDAIREHEGKPPLSDKERFDESVNVRAGGTARISRLEDEIKELETRLANGGKSSQQLKDESAAIEALDRVEALQRDANLRGETISPDQLAAALAGRYVFR